MAKFTKSNKTILRDGSIPWEDGTLQRMTEGAPGTENRITNAAPALDSNDYVIKSQVLTRVAENKTYYVDPSGSDAYTGSSATVGAVDPQSGKTIGPWRHPQYAVDFVSNLLVEEGYQMTIQLAKGLYKGRVNDTTDSTAIPVISLNNKALNNVVVKGPDIIEANYSSVTLLTDFSGYKKGLRVTVTNPAVLVGLVANQSFLYFEYNVANIGNANLCGVHKIYNVGSNYVDIIYQRRGPFVRLWDNSGDWPVTDYTGTMVYPNAAITGVAKIITAGFQVGESTTYANSACVNINNSTLSLQNICLYHKREIPIQLKQGIYSDTNSVCSLTQCGALYFEEPVRCANGGNLRFSDFHISCGSRLTAMLGGSIIGTYHTSMGMGNANYCQTAGSIWHNGWRGCNHGNAFHASAGGSIIISETANDWKITINACDRVCYADQVSTINTDVFDSRTNITQANTALTFSVISEGGVYTVAQHGNEAHTPDFQTV